MFCSYCGSKNTDDGKYCFKCGRPLVVVEADRPAPAVKTTHTLTIFRESQMFLINPPINLQINEKKDRAIANGETVRLELQEGIYKIVFTQSFRRRALEINLTGDLQITVKWNRMMGAIEAKVE